MKYILALLLTSVLTACVTIPEKATEPLAFVAIDCTRYPVPTLQMTKGDGTLMQGPLEALPEEPEAVQYMEDILRGKHEQFIDPACYQENPKDMTYSGGIHERILE